MKTRPLVLTLATALCVALGVSQIGRAGNIVDTDQDGVPDDFDNCVTIPNGPNGGPQNQDDGDHDGFGTACDCNFTQNGYVQGDDILELFGFFNKIDGVSIHDVAGPNSPWGYVQGDDVLLCFSYFNKPPG